MKTQINNAEREIQDLRENMAQQKNSNPSIEFDATRINQLESNLQEMKLRAFLRWPFCSLK